MSARGLAAWIGRTGTMAERREGGRAGLRFAVKVQDARLEWGHVRLLVVPVAGEGEAWIDSDRFRPSTSTSGEGVTVA